MSFRFGSLRPYGAILTSTFYRDAVARFQRESHRHRPIWADSDRLSSSMTAATAFIDCVARRVVVLLAGWKFLGAVDLPRACVVRGGGGGAGGAGRRGRRGRAGGGRRG